MFDKIFSWIPNSITMLNLLSGCMAIIMSFRAYETLGPLTGLEWAYVFMACAAFFDFMDGASARFLHRFSNLGKDLDSLSDLVSFGVAPAMMMFNVISHHAEWPVSAYAALLIPVFGAIRLAVFNNDSEQSTVFRGLPIPANAIFWIGMSSWISTYGYPGDVVMILLVALLSWAMVGRFKMFSLKFKSFGFNENAVRYFMIFCAALFVITNGLPGLVWTILLYFLLSVLRRRA